MCIFLFWEVFWTTPSSDSCIQQYGNVAKYCLRANSSYQWAVLPFLCLSIFCSNFLTQDDFGISSVASLTWAWKASKSDMSLLLFSCAVYHGIKYAKKAIKSKADLKRGREGKRFKSENLVLKLGNFFFFFFCKYMCDFIWGLNFGLNQFWSMAWWSALENFYFRVNSLEQIT